MNPHQIALFDHIAHSNSKFFYNHTTQCHPDADGFPFESGKFFLMLPQEAFLYHCHHWLAHSGYISKFMFKIYIQNLYISLQLLCDDVYC